jgi:ADP-ribose pyrophosphatase YjhB (NUDIX family)
MSDPDVKPAPAFRLTVKGAVIRDDELLLVEYRCPGDTGHFSLPGGRPEVGEEFSGALARKVRAETTLDVRVGPLLLVVEYVPDRHEGVYGQVHRVQLVFRCDPVGAGPARMPERHDPGQYAVHWTPLAALEDVALQPGIAVPLLAALRGSPGDGPALVQDLTVAA